SDSLLVGLRQEFDAGEELAFQPFHGVLVDAAEDRFSKSDFAVVNDRLVYGRELRPFRDASFVLFSVNVSHERPLCQIERMPFWANWSTARKLALTGSDEDWKRAKANLLIFYEAMLESPDLTVEQADRVFAENRERVLKLHEDALKVINASKDSAARKV